MNLTDLQPYARTVAHMATLSRPHLEDDAAQEGLIAAWRATESKPDASLAYCKAAVRHAVHDTVVRGQMTGSERPVGGAGQGLVRHELDTQALEVQADNGGTVLVHDVADDDVELALHRIELADLRATVRAAVRSLEPADRLHVYLRVWEGLTARQIAEETDSTEARVAARWNRTIRPRLVAILKEKTA